MSIPKVPITQAFLDEFERESEITRRFLERLPGDKLSWKPHAKSMSAGQLALHIAAAPGGIAEMAAQDSVPAPEFGRPIPEPKNVREVLEALDQSIATVKRILSGIDDARMHQTWSATRDGKEILAMPRSLVIRNILLNHIIQHRGQFGVYLRLLGVNVPHSYGPSADEIPDFLKQTQTA